MRLKMGHSSDSVTGISFLSYAYPAKRGAFAIYRQELANFEADVETHGPTFDFILQGQNLPLRFYPTRTKASISIINYGVSGAYRINDKLSLGVGLSSLESSYDQLTRRYDFDGAADVDFSDSNVVNTLKRSGGDRVTGFNVGFLWNAARTLSLGGVYRRRADFNLQEIIYETDSSGAISSSAGFTSTKFSIPTILALGVALKPNDQITVALELNRAKYSDIKFSPKGVRADDADEIHLGGEYVFVSPNYRVPLRLGAWHDPDHQPAFRGSVHEGDLDERVNALLFPRGKSQWHYAGGVGFAYSTKFQLDAGFDRSDSTKIFSLSAVYRF
jgi:long-subunit fatty acid transport protein